MRVRDWPEESRATRQRIAYRALLAVALSHPAMEGITFWGFTDKYSWIHYRFGADEPLLLDNEYGLKPAYMGCSDGALDALLAVRCFDGTSPRWVVTYIGCFVNEGARPCPGLPPGTPWRCEREWCYVDRRLYTGASGAAPGWWANRWAKIAPSFDGTVRELLHKKIREAFIHPQFNTDVMKPMLIERLLDQEVKYLSGGELQRVALDRVSQRLTGKPADLYLIDEPSAYLDSEQRISASKGKEELVLLLRIHGLPRTGEPQAPLRIERGHVAAAQSRPAVVRRR
ncbi:hypothetical protein EMIHUDRAFT_228116 [Emiliania huxleyi CCMP1516]|uniref:GH10 domain-containing protein n=2 Tax=Emiliania huxleyi TaxID=2903 RepID=A0A0D3KGG3_EMIH1|nr:hypothetical protein EMIHUDRAFT_228116 [Emiliania huxleyi CCMP1516]EOD34848.1 hypothetical protein EMIHUDRAFT_228116 [Emiliania huxleyi CCMP1516]|eukprot:XP_005787277.1 hypothetical protein EMIHUDRAFT_228116 [Emiliania huxleyi CCMP1516]